MTGAEIEIAIAGIVTLIQLLQQQIDSNDKLTPEEKATFKARIQFTQANVPEWK